MKRIYVFCCVAVFVVGCATDDAVRAPITADLSNPQWETQYQDSTSNFVGMSIVNENVVWVSSDRNRIVHTMDGGRTWIAQKVTEIDSLNYRDIHAFSAEDVVTASLGPGPAARVYGTSNAGQDWKLLYTAPEPDWWFDCFDFWDERGFLAVSSSEGLRILRTSDKGFSWQEVDTAHRPALIAGEHMAAASETCALAGEDGHGWITTRIPGTGTRVFRTEDFGATWAAYPTPVPSSKVGEGIASAAFFDSENGIAIGRVDSLKDTNTAITTDGGLTWAKGGRAVGGIVFGAAVVPGTSTPSIVAVSRDNGSGYSTDGGHSWTPISEENFWTVSFLNADVGWAAGRQKIARIVNRR